MPIQRTSLPSRHASTNPPTVQDKKEAPTSAGASKRDIRVSRDYVSEYDGNTYSLWKSAGSGDSCYVRRTQPDGRAVRFSDNVVNGLT